MRISNPIKIENISQALAKGGCAVCACLKNEQSALLKGTMQTHEIVDLCNFHSWAFAAASDVHQAANVFLKILKRRSERGLGHRESCYICDRLLLTEVSQLKELLSTLKRGLVLEWMEQQGTICAIHGDHLRQLAPADLRSTIDEIVSRTAKSLETELAALLIHSGRHEGSGGGALGRAAEFLTSQRGVNR
jgi:hypothetical protein